MKKRIILFAMLAAVTFNVFAPLLSITPGNTAHAISDTDKRWLYYFDDCLGNFIDYTGASHDNNGSNLEFHNYGEIYLSNVNDKGGERVVVGLDLDGANGVMSCATIGRHAAQVLNPSLTSNARQEEWLMQQIWGKTIAENGGNAIKVSEDRINRGVNDLKTKISKMVDTTTWGPGKRAALERLAPLIYQCFDLSNKSPAATLPTGSFKNEAAKAYGSKRDFDWKVIFNSKNGPNKHLDINGNDAPGGFTRTEAQLGDIELGWRPTGGSGFDNKSARWFPAGADIGSIVTGGSGDAANQGILSCDWVVANTAYLFGTSANDTRTRFTIGDDGKLHLTENNRVEAAPVVSAANGPGSITTSEAADASKDPNSCYIDPPLGWILNPICSGANQAIQALSAPLESMLKLAPLKQSDGGADAPIYTAWKAFRDIANAFLVLIFMIVIFAQVLPIELDAYTVKKVLPRLVAAAVAIQLSFFICQIGVDISNVLGAGIHGIFDSVSSAAKIPLPDDPSNGVATILVGIGGIALTLAFAGPVLFLLLAGFIAVLTTLITLEARQVIIIMLILLSPVAILAAILPNTETYFKSWAKNYVKLLLMYPLIVLILSGASLAHNILQAVIVGSGGGVIQTVLVNFIPVIAFMMIPATIKMSGSLMAGIGGAISSRGFGAAKSMTGRAKSGATASLKDRQQRAAALGADKSHGRLMRFGGRVASGAGLSSFNLGKRSKYDNARRAEEGLHEQQKLITNQFTEEGLNGDNAKLLDHVWDKKNKKFKDGTSKAEQIAAMQMLGENGGLEELAQIYEGLEGQKENMAYDKKTGEYKRQYNGKWGNKADRDVWQAGTTNSRASLAKALPHSVRPDYDKAIGKLDAEGVTNIKGVAGRSGHISNGLMSIKSDILAAEDLKAKAIAKGDAGAAKDQQDVIDAKKGQLQKAFSSMVGVGQSTDRRGRIDADVVKDWTKAVGDGAFDGIGLQLDVGGEQLDARGFAQEYITGDGQLKTVPVARASTESGKATAADQPVTDEDHDEQEGN